MATDYVALTEYPDEDDQVLRRPECRWSRLTERWTECDSPRGCRCDEGKPQAKQPEQLDMVDLARRLTFGPVRP